MWQLQWILNLIPESVLLTLYYLMLISGIVMLFAGKLMRWFPGLGSYKTPVQILGVVLTAGSLYLLGGYGVEMAWRERVKQLEERVRIAEEQANNKNTEIQEKVVEKTRVIKEKGRDIVKYVDREVVKKEEIIKYIEQCPVPKEIIDLHNQAADLNKAAEGKK